MTLDVGIAAGRVARRWYRAKGLTKTVTMQRVDQATGRVTYRRSTVRKRLLAHGRGFLCVNDEAEIASQLALPRQPGYACLANCFGKQIRGPRYVSSFEFAGRALPARGSPRPPVLVHAADLRRRVGPLCQGAAPRRALAARANRRTARDVLCPGGRLFRLSRPSATISLWAKWSVEFESN